MQKSILLKTTALIITAFCFLNELSAGWFICHVYKGKVGKDSVTLSIQIEKKYSTTKKNWLSIDGVCISNGSNEPIPLSGRLDVETSEIVISKKNDSVYWRLKPSGKSLIGSYGSLHSKSQPVNLQEVANLNDTTYHSEIETIGVGITQDTSLPKYLLRGIYSIRKYEDARMDRLELVDKKTNEIYQAIDVSMVDFPVGNLVTNIFRNVELRKNLHSDDGDLIIWCRAGKHGGYVTAVYDTNAGKYVLDPEAQPYDSDNL